MCVPVRAQWVTGYLTDNNGVLSVANIPWSKYDTIIDFAAYAGVNGSNIGNGSVNVSNLQDRALLIASRPAGKYVLLCLKDNDSFHNAFGQSAAAATRTTFVNNIVSTVTSNGYDGVDLDWESNVNVSDYVALIAALRAAMPTKLITTAMGNFSSLPSVAGQAYSNLDRINVMCYDMDSAGNGYSWFNHATLQSGNTSVITCDWMTRAFTTAGVPAAKIGVGIPFYGRRWPQVQQPLVNDSFSPTTVLYRDLAADTTRFVLANQQYDSTHLGQYLSIPSLNEFDSYTGTRQIADIVTWGRAQGYGGFFTFTLEYEYASAASGDARYPLSTELNNDAVGHPFPVDANGRIITGLGAVADNLLGPLIPAGNSPWIFGDLAEAATIDNMAPKALAAAPALGTQLAGTFSWSQGDDKVISTVDQRAALTNVSWVVFVWDSVDGVGTGRMLVPISSVTATQIFSSEHNGAPTSTGMRGYLMPPPVTQSDGNVTNFESWTTENPTITWDYYDAGHGINRWYYRTGTTKYLTWGRAYADIMWQWTLDHGYRSVAPRASAMLGQFFRALDGHLERLPGLYAWIAQHVPFWTPDGCPACDNREAGYMLLNIALGAKVDTDPTRHAQYCTWLGTYVPVWIQKQSADGSWGEYEFALNHSYVSAPLAYSYPLVWESSPWRSAIQLKGLVAAYEVLNSSSGCNNPTLAASALTTIKAGAAWIINYGRDNTNRGTQYEVNSQSSDQESVRPSGTVSITRGSVTLTGVGTTFVSSGYGDGTHFIGFDATSTVYQIPSCTSNTSCTINTAFGFFNETTDAVGTTFGVAPSAYPCHNTFALFCFGSTGDRNLVRTYVGLLGWLYSTTGDTTYKTWGDEAFSASMGGPTAGLTGAANIGAATLPCSGPACDGWVTDTWTAAPTCQTQPAPCVYGGGVYGNYGKNFGEAFGVPGIDNYLAWRLSTGTSPCDLNADGVTNVLDVQLMASQAIGTSTCVNRLAGGTGCNVFDVMRVVVAALGGTCRVGP